MTNGKIEIILERMIVRGFEAESSSELFVDRLRLEDAGGDPSCEKRFLGMWPCNLDCLKLFEGILRR